MSDTNVPINAVVMGVPCDLGTRGRPGARSGRGATLARQFLHMRASRL